MISDSINERISGLKNEFSEILFLKRENSQLFEKSYDKIKKLKEWYNNYVKENHDHLFIFGLDSFHYQGKIIDTEYDDMKRLYQSITNRMYCEYYKLYQIIVEYTEKVVKDKKVSDVVASNNNFPKYMDLEPYRQYGTETISQLHDIIVLLFSSVKGVIDKKHEELDMHRAKNKIGINIDNFIQTFHFEIMIMEQKLSLFLSYMEFFHKMTMKYLKRFTSKMNLFSSQIDHDIRLEPTSKTKERRKSMMQEFQQDNIGTELMNELADSVTSTTPTDSDASSSDESPKNIKKELKEPSFEDMVPVKKINTSTKNTNESEINITIKDMSLSKNRELEQSNSIEVSDNYSSKNKPIQLFEKITVCEHCNHEQDCCICNAVLDVVENEQNDKNESCQYCKRESCQNCKDEVVVEEQNNNEEVSPLHEETVHPVDNVPPETDPEDGNSVSSHDILEKNSQISDDEERNSEPEEIPKIVGDTSHRSWSVHNSQENLNEEQPEQNKEKPQQEEEHPEQNKEKPQQEEEHPEQNEEKPQEDNKDTNENEETNVTYELVEENKEENV
jgi:hypothetical protein